MEGEKFASCVDATRFKNDILSLDIVNTVREC